MKQNKMVISIEDLTRLEYIEDGNKLPNLKEWAKKEVCGIDGFLAFCQESGIDEFLFWHRFGTLLIGAKIHANYCNIFGMQYSGMVITTYVNSSRPNLLEFYLIKE